MTLRLFKGGKNLMCTTLKKYALNTYSGPCPHGCTYCYASVFRGYGQGEPGRPRYDIINEFKREVRTKEKLPVYISPLTDPYNPNEREHRVTRRVIQILSENGFPLLITTKSDSVLDDLDILQNSKCMVSFTITTLNKQKARIIEPYASSPEKRLEAIRQLSEKNILTTVRIQPIIPYFNDLEEELDELIRESKYSGVKHITSGTFKLVKPVWEKMKATLQADITEGIEKLYFEKPIRRWMYYYAPENKRHEIMKKVSDIVERNGIKSFGECREGFELTTMSCDGQHLAE